MKRVVGEEYPYREYMQIDRSGEKEVRLILVIVISDRARVIAKHATRSLQDTKAGY